MIIHVDLFNHLIFIICLKLGKISQCRFALCTCSSSSSSFYLFSKYILDENGGVCEGYFLWEALSNKISLNEFQIFPISSDNFSIIRWRLFISTFPFSLDYNLCCTWLFCSLKKIWSSNPFSPRFPFKLRRYFSTLSDSLKVSRNVVLPILLMNIAMAMRRVDV